MKPVQAAHGPHTYTISVIFYKPNSTPFNRTLILFSLSCIDGLLIVFSRLAYFYPASEKEVYIQNILP